MAQNYNYHLDSHHQKIDEHHHLFVDGTLKAALILFQIGMDLPAMVGLLWHPLDSSFPWAPQMKASTNVGNFCLDIFMYLSRIFRAFNSNLEALCKSSIGT